ncbi:hypothetical protein UlMin_037124 [Ulmus minor]
MEQLVSMGFTAELAEEALSATGGNSISEAADWILRSNPPSSSSSPASIQPKLDRFFNIGSKPTQSTPPSPSPSPPPPLPLPKRPKLSQSHSQFQPLSERMRPRTIDQVLGQDHLLSGNSLLRSAIQRHRLPSLLFWGPPGTGKTSIARAILNSSPNPSSYRFVSLSAVTSGVKDVRDAVDDARKARHNKSITTLLFVDEIHRFNKSQQDSFLPIIEDGTIIFMGATTENPSFHLITPLLSRCRVLLLHPLKPNHIALLLNRAAADSDRGLAATVGMAVRVEDEAVEFISANCDGDARVGLNALEISATRAASRVRHNHEDTAIEAAPEIVVVTLEDAKEAMQCKHLAYDKGGEEHYNLISALHKSMRGTDANAAIYWLARMLEGGEEPLYIARRLIRFASEDVGLADPLALNQAVSCYQACHFLGMPECNVVLAQCAAYLALAPKSVAVYEAIGSAQNAVKESAGQNEGVPLHLRNAPTKLMKEVGYGDGYIYPPHNPGSTQSYLPPSLEGYKFLDWPSNSNSKFMN